MTKLFQRNKPQIGPRTILLNNSAANTSSKFSSNKISTTKYTYLTWLPYGLYEQFRRVANLYFLFHAILSLTPVSPVNPVTTIGPLVFVIGLAMLKELWEDVQRGRQDRFTNLKKVEVLRAGGVWEMTTWKDVATGDIVSVKGDEPFPADLVCLKTSDPDGVCYVETMNLDGETNLKMRKAVPETQGLSLEEIANMGASIECEQPNVSIYTFVGNLALDGAVPLSLGPSQILLRGSTLRNTEFAMGAAVFTGHDTKIMMNATSPPSKRSTIERRLDKLVLFQLALLIVMSIVTAVIFAQRLRDHEREQWYLQPTDTSEKNAIASAQFNWRHPAIAGLLQFFTSLVLYGYFVPISLYVSIEIVKTIQARFIGADLGMYYDEKNIRAQARTSNLNEELGMVKTILSDKTGTLTRNQMDFFKCSIGGTAYGRGSTEVERAAAMRRGGQRDTPLEEEFEVYVPEKPLEPGFNMRDERLEGMRWLQAPDRDLVRRFLEILAVCHTVVTSGEPEPGSIRYQAESPDEAAFVVAAKRFGLFFFGRTRDVVHVREYGPGEQPGGVLQYQLLNTLAFTSQRKRMSVVVRTPTGELVLFCKGADSVVVERLALGSAEQQALLRTTQAHMTQYAEAGLRTLALAYKPLDPAAYANWQARWVEAKADVSSAERQAERLEQLAEELERGLILVGATAIEDKLQVGVPEAIENLAKAGIKLWVLTGDKLETAINISYACSLIRQGMAQHVISLMDNDEVAAQARAASQDPGEFYAGLVAKQIAHAEEEWEQDRAGGGGREHAVVIDGKSLEYVLGVAAVQARFLRLALGCASVVCCRVSPKQKALVTDLVRRGGKQICLSVGDGANDVGMIQRANIGVGIAGEEGQQAVMAADFAIGQFRFLERLVLVHGGWSYKRITRMINYFFYKNFVFGFSIFYFNCAADFSGTSIYWDWYLSLYNVIFTSVPVCVMACIDQDVKAVLRLRFPGLYLQSQRNTYFTVLQIAIWLADGIYQSLVCFFFTLAAYWVATDSSQGRMQDYLGVGTTMFTAVVLVVNLEMAVVLQYWTWVHHLALWGSIVVYWLFVLIVGVLPVSFSNQAYRLYTNTASSAVHWLVLLLTIVAALTPTYVFRTIQRNYFPEDHHIIQEISRQEFLKRRRGAAVGDQEGSVGGILPPAGVEMAPQSLHHRGGAAGEKELPTNGVGGAPDGWNGSSQ